MKIKFRHKLVSGIVRPVLIRVLKKKFNLTYETSDLKPPFIVLANHTTDYDAFFVNASFKTNIYFVMSDHVSSLKTGKLIRHLVSPIPITKSSIDAETVKNIYSVLKQGGAVGIFPEGNKSFAGGPSWIKPSTAKLVRKAGVPIVLYNIQGGYLSTPRWSKNKRKGHIHGFVREVIYPQDMENMTNDELYDKICNGLNVNAYEIQNENKVQFVGENLADNIEALLYYCPKCNSFGTVYGEGNNIKCKNCDLNGTYTNYGYLENAPFTRLDEWDKWQKERLSQEDFGTEEKLITEDHGWEIQVKETKFKSVPLGEFTTQLTNKHFILKNESTEIKIALPDIVGTAIEGTCSIQLSLRDGTVYRLKKELNTCGLKYVNIISKLNNIPYKF